MSEVMESERLALGGAAIEVLRWRDMSQRVVELEAASRELRRRVLVGIGINACLLLAVLTWLVLPNRTLTVGTLSADEVVADLFATRSVTMDTDGLAIVNSAGTARLSLSLPESDVPTLAVENDGHGRVVLGVRDTPFFEMYADTSTSEPGGSQPRIEMSLVGEEKLPRIVLRDANDRVIWQAP